MAGKRWKSYCSEKICPPNCQSMMYIKSAQRMCYDDKYNLPQVKDQIRYKDQGRTNVVATGVIEHNTFNEDGKNYLFDHTRATWETNFKEILPYRNDKYVYLIEETCKSMKISYKKFIKTLVIISNNIL
jgi:hypothetical protein